MGLYRKKPVIIEAVRVIDITSCARNNWAELDEWVIEAYNNGLILFTDEGIHVQTLEGKMFGENNDFLIKGVAGEIYCCKPHIFTQTYEEVI